MKNKTSGFCTFETLKLKLLSENNKASPVMNTIKSNKEGKNIHSPFVYRLVANVLFAPYPFYAFQEIDKFTISRQENDNLKKYFRLINHFNVDTVIEVGTENQNLKEACRLAHSDIQFKQLEKINDTAQKKGNKDYSRLLIFHNTHLADDLPVFPDNAEIWIFEKEEKKKEIPIFTELKSKKKVQLTIELSYLSIAIFNKNMDKQNYVIK